MNFSFDSNFDLAEEFDLSMYFVLEEGRDNYSNFIEIVKSNRNRFKHGVVFAYPLDNETIKECLDLDLYIGVTAYALRKPDNAELVASIPMEKLVIGTNSP